MDYDKLTKYQKAAVNETGSILVSAAAGSGKTAVLVERIIRELTVKKPPLRADRLLVVTFTKAAAKEMRSRLEKGIEEYCRKNPQDKQAAEQKILLGSAVIGTIDSFCIQLVRENFQKAGVGIDFKIIEEKDLNLIKEKAVSEVFEKHFEAGEENFLKLLDTYGAIFDEKPVAEAVMNIYEESRYMPFPKSWLNKMLSNYSEGSFDMWRNTAIEKAKVYLNRALRYLNAAQGYFAEDDEKMKAAYYPSLENGKERINAMLDFAKKGNWNSIYAEISGFKFEAFKPLSNPMYPVSAETVKELKKLSLNQVKAVQNIVYATEEGVRNHYEVSAPLSAMLIELTKEYYDAVQNALLKKGMFDFNDIEHMAFELLCEEKDGEISLKEDAKEYIANYDEVFVDEYQDVNDLQDKLFYFISDMGKHLFAVGDVKQSIYSFRGANPENFLNKQEEAVDYKIAQGGLKSIILGSNFRSRDGICNCVNFIFDKIMTKDFCGIDYKKTERLSPKAEFPETDIPCAEFHLVNAFGYKERKAEAMHIADTIIEIMNSGETVKDKNTKKMRKARFSDFAIIARGLKSSGAIITEELKKRGIPVTYTKEGFLESKEIAVILSLLSVIDNPTKEIELLSVLMSPLFRFTPDDMADIRCTKRKVNLYSALVMCAQQGNKKCADFIEFTALLRRLAAVMPLSKLIAHIYDLTDYVNIVSMMDDASARKENLSYLIRLASSFEGAGNYGIGNFINSLQRLADGKLKGAVLSAGKDSVQVMTVHHSKGLQFPICFFAFTGSAFNNEDASKSLIINAKYGISFRYFDNDGKVVPIDKKLLATFAKEQQLKEELRMLYVAATRAEDRLIITAARKNPEKALSDIAIKLMASDNEITEDIYATANSILAWVMPCMLLHPDGEELRKLAGYKFTPEGEKGDMIIGVYNVEERTEKSITFSDSADEETVNEIKKRINYKYPYDALRFIESKASVSDIVHKAEIGSFDFTSRPGFMNKSGLTPTQRGTAVHKIMQYMDFDNIRKDFDGEILRLKEWEYITEQEAQTDTEHIRIFTQSQLFNRMCSSSDLRREMRFLTNMSANMVDKDLPEELNEEKIIVQGAVDCLFVEEGKIVVVDFKTDRVKEEKQLVESYAEQLNIYAKACEKILGLPVKEKIIYSLVLDRAIVV